jgi:uncharacterized protein (TIRG00374 family)
MEHTSHWLALLRKAVPTLLVLAAVAWGAWYVTSHPEELVTIEGLAPGWLLLLFALATIKIGCMGLFTKFVVSALGIELDSLEWFGISGMSAMANYLTPFRGGAAVRAVYLKSRHGLSYALFLSTLSTLYVLSLASSAAVGLLAVAILYTSFGFVDIVMAAFLGGVLMLPVAFLGLARAAPPILKRWTARGNAGPEAGSSGGPLRRATRRMIEIISLVVEGWHIISGRPTTLWRLACTSLLNSGVTLLMIHVAFVAFGAQLLLPASLVLSSLFMIASLIPLTPSGLGAAEIAVVMASQGLGVQAAVGVFSVGLNRAVMILTSILWGALFTYVLGRRAVVASAKDIEQEV